MLDVLLHAGHEHPNLTWVLLPSILSFVAGVGVGLFHERIRAFVSANSTAPTDR